MSLEGDTADKLVHEGIEITESALKLAGLGAKNLAALLLALLKDNEKLKGKTGMNTLLRQDRQLSVFHVKKSDMGKFGQLAKTYGVLFAATYNKHQDKNICDVMVKGDDAARVNRIMEMLEYPAPGKEAEGKNAEARAPQNGKSKGRGLGWMPRLQNQVNDPAKTYAKKTGPLESLGAETLAAMVLKLAGENHSHENAAPLSNLLAGKELCTVAVLDIDTVALQRKASSLEIPLTFLPTDTHGKHTMLAQKSDAPIINRMFEQAGYAQPSWPKDSLARTVLTKSVDRSVPAKTSVKDKVEQAKVQIRKPEKPAPVKARQKSARSIRSQAR